MLAVLKVSTGAGLILAMAVWALPDASDERTALGGFWFEPVAFESPLLGGAVTAADLATIETVARAELAHAFAGLAISIANRRDVRYHVRVVQQVPGPPLTRKTWVAGSSYAVPGFGGSGSVNFTYFASGALVFAPPQASRAELIDAIGRGIGRGAAHEFAHQFLSGDALHSTRDRGSYEYHAASRPEQYYGPMHWDTAGPLLASKFGR